MNDGDKVRYFKFWKGHMVVRSAKHLMAFSMNDEWVYETKRWALQPRIRVDTIVSFFCKIL